ncbi:MAG: hypothetical protein ACKN9S_19080 [Pirellula sp.]
MTLTQYFPDSQSVSGDVAFDTVNMTNEDSWSFLTLGGGQIKTSGGQDDQVIATGGSSARATETLTYEANATRSVESIHPAWDYLAKETRNATYNKQIVSTTAFDPNDPDAVDPSPVISGDDRVLVTGNQWYLRVRKMPAGPGPQGAQGEYEESYFVLATGQRRTRTNNPTSGAGLDGMDLGGDPLSGDPWIITYEEDWDPRNVYESELDGIPLPEGRIPSYDRHLYVLPEGYKAPTSNTNGRSWTDFVIGVIGGRRGDVNDQLINFYSGFGDGASFGLSWLIRSNNPLFGDNVDYDSNQYFFGGIASIIVPGTQIGKVKQAVTAVSALNKADDLGRCASQASKIISGGCFIEGTIVTVSSLPGRSSPSDSLWSDPSWLDEPSQETPWLAPERYASVATRTQLQIPIESVPIGARVPTKNPEPLCG